MSWIFSDKTPAVLALLLGLLTWQTGKLFDEVRSGKAIIYDIGHDAPKGTAMTGSLIVLKIENPSRSELAGPFSFTIVCPIQHCMAEKPSVIIDEPIVSNARATLGSDEQTAQIQATLPPGAIVWLAVKVNSPVDVRTLHIRSAFRQELNNNNGNENDQKPIRVIREDSIEAQIAIHWISSLYWGIVLVCCAICLWIILALIASWRGISEGVTQRPRNLVEDNT